MLNDEKRPPADKKIARKAFDGVSKPGETRGRSDWPSPVLEWQGVPGLPPFESYRDELLAPGKDIAS